MSAICVMCGPRCMHCQEELDKHRQQLTSALAANEQNLKVYHTAAADLRQQLATAQQALRNVYEVWAGSEAVWFTTNPLEKHLLRLVEQMRDAAKEGMK